MVVEWECGLDSSLLHNRLTTADLALNLFPSPSCSFNGAGLEFAVGLGLLDHSIEPI